jgi:hypothetical protein
MVCMNPSSYFSSRNFAPIISNVACLAKKNLDGQHYYVLLIITDGIITDMQETTEVSFLWAL